MRKQAIILACTGSLALGACTMNNESNEAMGALAGLAAGVVTANVLNANKEWTIIAALAGAAAGSMVARNNATQECAYSNGDGTARIAPCP